MIIFILVILHKIFLAAGSLYTTNTTEACKIGPSFAPGVISNATGRFLFFTSFVLIYFVRKIISCMIERGNDNYIYFFILFMIFRI